jgi:uncharacterized membrane-anchored protein YhcB (DUF1043 family)
MKEADFDKAVKAVTPADLAPQAPGGAGLRSGEAGKPLPISSQTAISVQLVHAGQGLYNVRAGTTLITNAQGQRITIRRWAMIDAMFQEGTDKALDDQLQRPTLRPVASPNFWAGSLSALPRGIGAGTAEGIAFGAELAGAFGDVMAGTGTQSAGGMFSTQTEKERRESEASRQRTLNGQTAYSNEAGDLFRQRARDLMPDPQTTGTGANLLAGIARFGTKAVAYTLGGNPFGAGALGLDEALTESDRLKLAGVDLRTRSQAGAVAGVVAAGSMMAPMSGSSALVRFGKGAAVGEASMIAQSAAEKAILEHAGYDKIGSTFDPFDPVALAVGLVPGAIGARFGRPSAKQLAALKTEADVRTAAALSPDEQARSAAFERSAANIKELEAAIKSEKDAGNRLTLVNELEKQRTAHRDSYVKDSMRAEPDMEPAARVRQVVDALDESRLTPDSDLRGMAAHQEAIETAHEQIARGEPVEVTEIVPRLESFDEFAARQAAPETGGARPPPDQFLRWLRANGGVSIAEKFDITGERNAIRANRGGVFSKAGRGIERSVARVSPTPRSGNRRPPAPHHARAGPHGRGLAGPELRPARQPRRRAGAGGRPRRGRSARCSNTQLQIVKTAATEERIQRSGAVRRREARAGAGARHGPDRPLHPGIRSEAMGASWTWSTR